MTTDTETRDMISGIPVGPPPASSRAVKCCNCGLHTGEFTTDPSERAQRPLGPCCTDLPPTWDEPDEDEDEEEEDSRPHCSSCGASAFYVRERQTISYSVSGRDNEELNDATLWINSGYGDTEADGVDIECVGCGVTYYGAHDWT